MTQYPILVAPESLYKIPVADLVEYEMSRLYLLLQCHWLNQTNIGGLSELSSIKTGVHVHIQVLRIAETGQKCQARKASMSVVCVGNFFLLLSSTYLVQVLRLC